MLHSIADVSDVILDECQFTIVAGDELHAVKHILCVIRDEGQVAFPICTHAQSLHVFGHFRFDKTWESLAARITAKSIFFLQLGAPFAGIGTGLSKSIGSTFSAGSFTVRSVGTLSLWCGSFSCRNIGRSRHVR